MKLKKKWTIGLIICFIFLAFFLSKFMKNRELPVILHGVWENSDPNYMNRYFLIDTNAIRFGTGDGKVDWYEIVSVKERPEGNSTFFTIEYQKPKGALLKKSLIYFPENGGRIKFKNQKTIAWFRINT